MELEFETSPTMPNFKIKIKIRKKKPNYPVLFRVESVI